MIEGNSKESLNSGLFFCGCRCLLKIKLQLNDRNPKITGYMLILAGSVPNISIVQYAKMAAKRPRNLRSNYQGPYICTAQPLG